jgi:V/A-type H+/Na+-transporting ATPase subunit K
LRSVSAVLICAVFASVASLFLPVVHAQSSSTGAAIGDIGAKYLAAAIAFGLSAAGAGYGIAHAGSAGLAAVAEKPELRTTALIFVALAEAIAIYGFVIAIIILGQTG